MLRGSREVKEAHIWVFSPITLLLSICIHLNREISRLRAVKYGIGGKLYYFFASLPVYNFFHPKLVTPRFAHIQLYANIHSMH